MRIGMSTPTSRRNEVEGKIIKHRALFAGEDRTRHVLPFSVPPETLRFSHRVDKKESQYLQITGSVYHSHVTLKSLARINVAERSGFCLEGGVWGEYANTQYGNAFCPQRHSAQR